MQVSPETIYQSLYVQGRGALRAELKQFLRRQKRGETGAGKVTDRIMVSERPPEAEDRALPGHWEGDLLIGRAGKSAVATLVERHSRYVMLAALPEGRTAEVVMKALAKLVKTLPEQLRKTLTSDQRKEMVEPATFTVASGVQVSFCAPELTWLGGSNENTNGLLRQFLPKTADLSQKSQTELDEIARLMNNRPRETLKWLSPSKVFNAAVVAAIG